MKRDREGALYSARLARPLTHTLSRATLCDDRRSRVQSAAVASCWYGNLEPSSKTTRRQDCGRLCERCSTRGWWWAWQLLYRSTAADGRQASVPGLHKNMRRRFRAVRSCLVCAIAATAECRPCSFPVASRLSFGPRLSDSAAFPLRALQNMAVGVNYGTGAEMTLGQRRNAEQDACEDSEARHATRRVCAIPACRLCYVEALLLGSCWWRCICLALPRTCVGRQLYARLGRRIAFVVMILESGARLTHNVATRYLL